MSVVFRRGATGVGDPEISDSERRHADQIKFGVVREVDYTRARVRVAVGDEDDDDGHILTGWLPMPGGRAAPDGDREWHPLEVDERVVILSESGEVPNAVVLPAGIYNEAAPAPGDVAGLWRKAFANGAVIEYNRNDGEMLLDATAAGALTLRAGGCEIELRDGTITITASAVKFERA